MKKALSLVLSSVLVLANVLLASAAGFPDVDSNYSWAQEAINSLSENGVITGYDDGTFKPGNSITRQEAVTLLSKALGAGESMNESIVNLAFGIYEAELGECSDSYAVKQGAYMIYRKVLTSDEVNEYLSKENRNLELKRYEAATLIAKALGADSWMKTNPEIDVEFSDKDDIPAIALGYVYYATELGIMNGMGDNKFGPGETVTRAQIAVMIQRILDTMDFEYIRGMISSVDTLMNNLSIKTEDGETVKFGVGNSSAILLDGEKVTLTDLEVGMECVFTFSKESLYQVDAITYEGEETVSGAYRGKQTTNAGTTVKLADITKDDLPVSSYKLAANVVIKINGSEGAITDIKNGDFVTIKMSGGLGVSLSSEPKTKKISSVKIESMDTSSNGVIITVRTNDDETAKYALADNATIMRNGKSTGFSELAIGDNAEITLEYGEITDIMATGKAKSIEGTIEEITISSSTSYITISSSGSQSKYTMARDCTVTLEGEEASVYDLRLGAYVKLEVSSETVTEIASEAVSESLTVTGTIKTINSSYGLVVITYEGSNGQEVEKQLFLKDSSKILDTKTGKLLTIKSLAAGNVITAAGTEKLGVYEVSSLMVLQ